MEYPINGYRINTSNLMEVNSILNKYREECVEIAISFMSKYVWEKSTQFVDFNYFNDLKLNLHEIEGEEYSDVFEYYKKEFYQKIKKGIVEKEEKITLSDKFSVVFDAFVYPTDKDFTLIALTHNTLFSNYGVPDYYDKELLSKYGLDDYQYYRNVNSIKNISKQENKERIQNWNKYTKLSVTDGFLKIIVNYTDLKAVNELYNKQLSLSERQRRVSEKLFKNTKIREHYRKHNGAVLSDDCLNEMMISQDGIAEIKTINEVITKRVKLPVLENRLDFIPFNVEHQNDFTDNFLM